MISKLKPRRRDREDRAPASHVTTRATLESMRHVAPKPQRSKRIDTRVGRRREHADSIDDFELELLRHGLNLEDLFLTARSYDQGTRTPFAKLAHAVMQWWCSLPLGPKRVVWVDPQSGYTEANLPKFSTAIGQELMNRGLAGGRWVHTRLHLLEARQWRREMLAMSPAERLKMPMELDDERVAGRK